jgi:hypothetical protein
MPLFPSYFGIATAIVVGIFAVVVSNKFAVIPLVPPVTSTSITTTSVSAVTESKVVNATTTATTTEIVPKKVSELKVITPSVKLTKDTKQKSAASQLSASTQMVTPAPLASSGNLSFDTVASSLRGALVNIICYAPVGSGLRSISGSGIFIDAKGIILTNAHIAQYFLLADRHVSCTIRTGSPAIDAYKAAIIYISPAWIHANATVLTQTLPSGTGEYDFAFLAVTASATSNPLPVSFPSLSLAQVSPSAQTPVVIASYGAQFLEPNQIQSSLYPTIVFGSVKNVLTFSTTTIDVLALGGSAAAQEGSSGGGVADASGMLVGTITTSTVTGETSTRSLGAITASYIRSAYAREMSSSLDTLLAEPTATAVAEFASQIPILESIITAHL